MHAVNNTNPSILAVFTNEEKANAIMADSILSFAILEIPVVILGIICFVLLCRDKETLAIH